MIDFFKKRLEQLADTLIDPMWQRVLAWPWPARALTLIVALGAMAIAAFPQSTRALLHEGANVVRVVIANPSDIPFDAPTSHELNELVSRLSTTLEPDLMSFARLTPWVLAQETLATYPIRNVAEPKRIVASFRERSETTCGCWTDIPGSLGRPRNIFVSGWIFVALARLGESATWQEIGFLLNEQNDAGWWSVFPVPDDSQYASSYGTAWALLGLNAQLATKSWTPEDAARIVSSIRRGAVWLLAHRENGARWKDYPLVTNGKISESVSGVVLHALHRVLPKEVNSLDAEWLDNLPAHPVPAGDSDYTYLFFPTKYDNQGNDDYVQIKLPWLLIATTDAFVNGTVTQRAKGLAWLENALAQKSVATADTTSENWWRAELLYALRYMSDRQLRATD